MKTTGKLTIFVLAFLILAASADAESPREQLKQMVEQLRTNPSDSALREKIIQFATTIKPAPAIPEEARRSFIIGEALFKQAHSLRPAYQAAQAFWTATTLAPWWSDAYWNLAVAEQFAGQYVSAKESLRLYLLTNPSAADTRAAQDRLYAIDADTIAAASRVPGGITGFWQRLGYQSQGTWTNEIPDNPRTPSYEIQHTGSTYNIRCIRCEEDWKVSVISANINAITFSMRLDDMDPINHECTLKSSELYCRVTHKDGGTQERYAKRSICEIVGGPGILGYFVLCK